MNNANARDDAAAAAFAPLNLHQRDSLVRQTVAICDHTRRQGDAYATERALCEKFDASFATVLGVDVRRALT